MTTFVAPKQCRRCAGTGTTGHHRDQGRCYGCGGAGQIETDGAALAAKAARDAGRKALGLAAFNHSAAAHVGLSKLEMDEPERLEKAIKSFQNGDPRVLPALEAYGS